MTRILRYFIWIERPGHAPGDIAERFVAVVIVVLPLIVMIIVAIAGTLFYDGNPETRVEGDLSRPIEFHDGTHARRGKISSNLTATSSCRRGEHLLWGSCLTFSADAHLRNYSHDGITVRCDYVTDDPDRFLAYATAHCSPYSQ